LVRDLALLGRCERLIGGQRIERAERRRHILGMEERDFSSEPFRKETHIRKSLLRGIERIDRRDDLFHERFVHGRGLPPIACPPSRPPGSASRHTGVVRFGGQVFLSSFSTAGRKRRKKDLTPTPSPRRGG